MNVIEAMIDKLDTSLDGQVSLVVWLVQCCLPMALSTHCRCL